MPRCNRNYDVTIHQSGPDTLLSLICASLCEKIVSMQNPLTTHCTPEWLMAQKRGLFGIKTRPLGHPPRFWYCGKKNYIGLFLKWRFIGDINFKIVDGAGVVLGWLSSNHPKSLRNIYPWNGRNNNGLLVLFVPRSNPARLGFVNNEISAVPLILCPFLRARERADTFIVGQLAVNDGHNARKTENRQRYKLGNSYVAET